MTSIYINRELNIRVNINEDKSFCILGDEEKVTDEMLWDLAEGILPAGWQNELDYIAAL